MKRSLISLTTSSVQSLSHAQPFATPWIAAHQASLSITNSRSLPKLTSIESVMPSSHLILCRRLLLLPPIPSTNHQGIINQNHIEIPFHTPRGWLQLVPLLGYLREMKTYVDKKNTPQNLYVNVHRSIILWKQLRWLSSDGWIKNLIYSYNGILFIYKNEPSTNTCYHVDEPRKHC